MPDDRPLLLGLVEVGAGDVAVADEGDPAGPGELADAVGADRLDERLELRLLARDLDHHLVGPDVDDPAAEDLDQGLQLGPAVSDAFTPPFRFTGTLRKVTVRLE